MKIAIVSDTHGNITNAYDSLSEQKVDMLIHLGDYYEDGENLGSLLGISSYSVKGNNDYHIDGKEQLILNIEGKRILLTHGHKYNVSYGLEDIIRIGKELEIDICMFGHTHRYLNCEMGGLLLLNPGSPSLPRGDGISSYMIYDTDENKIERIEC
ncbi:MAG: metallophosphoesterase [Finegoldia sp.]|nr:metallophosphoesterase [Finegoldia sp.]